MTPIEVQECIAKFAALWPLAGFTDEEMDLFGRKCLEHERGTIIDQLEHLKLTSRHRPTLADIFAPIRASSEARHNGPVATAPTFANVIRQQQQGRANGLGDYEVLLRDARQKWRRCGQRESYRKGIRDQLVRDLIAHGMMGSSRAKFRQWAEYSAQLPFLDDEGFDEGLAQVNAKAPRVALDNQQAASPDERLNEVRMFRTVTYKGTSGAEAKATAMQALARAA